MNDKGQVGEPISAKTPARSADIGEFVLDKSIFSNVFNKDIRRVYVYKKVERLAKAIHLVTPAFAASASLKDRLDRVSIGLIDAAILSPSASREALSRELLALSSILSMARTGGMLSPMNADLIAREAHTLLQEIASYEEPRLMLDEVPTLAVLAKTAGQGEALRLRSVARITYDPALHDAHVSKGHVSDKSRTSERKPENTSRREAILSVLRTKGPSSIRDLSTVIRDVSEKTIQRELSVLVGEGTVTRTGDRRWTTYAIAG